MIDHSIRVGRALLADGRDAITVFGGYCHDVIEDTEESKSNVLAFARTFFLDRQMALVAADLVEECSYTEEEYELPKLERKKAAVGRWSSTNDIRVAYVKMADVEDNRADCVRVSSDFKETYLSWAQPLHDNLGGVIERLSKQPSIFRPA